GIVLSGTASEIPANPAFSVSWSKVTGPGDVRFSDPASVSTGANFSAWGTYVLRLTAADGPFTASSDMKVTATPTITVGAGGDQSIRLPAGVTLSGTANEIPASSGLFVQWTKLNGPGSVTFSNASSLNTTANFSDAGTYILRLTASDGP